MRLAKIKEFWLQYWLPIICIIIASISDGVMDHINFRYPYDSGFWSIHTTDTLDAWHTIKKIKWAAIIIGMVRVGGVMVVLSVLNLIFHELVLHKILRRKK